MLNASNAIRPGFVSWDDLGDIVTAHVISLRDASVLDDAALGAVLSAIDAVRRGTPDPFNTIRAMIAGFDERLDALSPPGVVGVGAVGRAHADTSAALVRLAVRRALLSLAAQTLTLRQVLIEVAGVHAATTMPAFAGGQVAQPVTFGHFLGGTIGPLGRSGRLMLALDDVDLSPMGAAALAGAGFPFERERVAGLLGFPNLVEGTFDAASAVDHLGSAATAADAIALTLRRLLVEVRTWMRTDPDAFILPERWRETDPALPQYAAPVGLDRRIALADAVAADALATQTQIRGAEYGPAAGKIDAATASCLRAIGATQTLVADVTDLLNDGFDVNRAYLANRAGRGHSTTSDLAVFLIETEGVEPGPAAQIAALVVRRAMAEGIEASGITVQMIDAAALLVLGRELAVEFEAISRYLAPRRFLERRMATGGAAPAATRRYLERESERLTIDRERLADRVDRIAAARAERERLTAEALDSSA